MPPPSAVPLAPRVLLVEDDEVIRLGVGRSLEAAGLVTRVVADGDDLEHHLEEFGPDVVVLDWMLPGRDGTELVGVVRRRSTAGVVMLTARETIEDRLQGFELGVDDYVSKPFVTEELLARVRAVARRLGRLGDRIEIDDLIVDEDAGIALRAGQRLMLTATEFRLLTFLAHHRNRVLSNAQILSQVWGYDEYADNLVQVHLSALRRKLEEHGPRLIHTERGLGYVIRAPRVAETAERP